MSYGTAAAFVEAAMNSVEVTERRQPQFKEPRRALVKAMQRRAKKSHLGAFQILPEPVLLSLLARLPRLDHDAVADCSTGFRSIVRSERFLKARRAEDITEEALVLVGGDCFMALVSGRVWRRLAPKPAEMRISGELGSAFVARAGLAVIGPELFMAGGLKQTGTYADVSVYEAVEDEWFTIPLSSSAYPRGMPRELFAVACAGRLYVGGLSRHAPHRGRVLVQSWDPDAQRWVDLPPMPPPLPRPMLASQQEIDYQVVAVAVGSKIYVLDRWDPYDFSVFDTETETWTLLEIPDEVPIVDLSDHDGPWFGRMPWPGICVDRTLIRVWDYTTDDEDNPTLNLPYIREHYAYDTVNDRWIRCEGGMPRHTAYGESGRILSVVNYNGPNDYVDDHSRYSPGGVHVLERRGEHGEHGTRLNEIIDLPVRYDAVERVVYVDMP